MSGKEPIDYDSPLGISKQEWKKVLGANLALLLLVYLVALIFTLCGNDFFLLNFNSDNLDRIEETLRGWGIFALVQIAFETIEATLIIAYVAKWKIKFWVPIAVFCSFVLVNLTFWWTIGYLPSWAQFANSICMFIGFVFVFCHKSRNDVLFGFARLAIALVVSFVLNEAIALMRMGIGSLWHSELPNVFYFALNFEYDIALVLSLIFLTTMLPFGHKKGDKQCPTTLDASGSSPTSLNSSPKNSPKKKTKIELTPSAKKRLRILKIKVYTIQTTAIIVIAFLPWAVGRPAEFALVYASFYLTRMTLGFSHSLHFKSELACVSIGALTFWLLTFLTPSVDACIIMALVYGSATAIGFRLYWELHDLLLYKKASKSDRYAMIYASMKGDVSKKHIVGVMRAKGYAKEDIQIIVLYMERLKVEGIAIEMNYSKRFIESRITEIANDLYATR